MPVWLWAVQLIFMIVQPLINFVLRLLGIGFITYVGYNVLLEQVTTYVTSRMGSSTLVIQQILGLAKIDVAINIFLAAVTTRLVIAGLNKAQDSRRAQVWRKPGGTSIEA
ncbi:DUF2523 family protein [Pseudomonas sp. Gutcm_11s]|uniref:DUF2523 family protein n=1 Tax=Pseudomonas sp. Gutcm_11s TaxID=3026088 RepID=UPI002361D1D7|nr:DUF2523 family protein [Pseudomonas sp. Gutcm_11s]MDD0844624.1 DUF2523 family protein [Pseudomonas sp. Gutcm_11s]